MRVAILSTDTRHHEYFIKGIVDTFHVPLILYESTLTKAPGSPWYREQAHYEAMFFGDLGNVTLAPTVLYPGSINNPIWAKVIKEQQIDIGMVFGTGKLQPYIFNAPRWGCINVHRGISQHYRGLDSELWAIYRGDIQNVGVTIHYIDETLDTGDVLAQERVVCGRHIELYQLRAVQTVTALHMVRQVLKRFEEQGGPIEGKPQGKGKYYSAMSLADKFHTLERYNRRLEETA